MIGISFFTLLFKLIYKDSNLELQSQNLSCYHYTIDHCFIAGAKVRLFFEMRNKKSNLLQLLFPNNFKL